MKSQIVLVFVFAVVGLDNFASSECTCSQWTCTTNVCEKPQTPQPDPAGCKRPRRGVQNVYEEAHGGILYSIQMDSSGNYDSSNRKCISDGFSYLASVTTDDQKQFLDRMLTNSGFRSASPFGNQFWVSYNNGDGLGWKWAPSGNTNFQKSWWATGQPSGDGSCIAMTSEAGSGFNDGSCESQIYRICSSLACPPRPGCKTPQTNVSGVYEESDGDWTYSLQVDAKLNYDESLRKCQASGFTYLVTVSSNAQKQFLDRMLTTSGFRSSDSFANQFWIAYNNGDGQGWRWPPSMSAYFEPAWWLPGQPSGDGVCTTMTSAVGSGFNDGSCESKLYRICAAPSCY